MTQCLGAAGALLYGVLSYRGCEPLCRRGGAAYIESADPSSTSVTQGFNETVNVRAFLVTATLNDLYSDELTA
jgi:hypothetical protein